MTDPDKIDQLLRINQAFRPSVPIDNYALFAGRVIQIRKIVNAITQTGLHVVLYGERGVGKTSLVSIIGALIGQSRLQLPPIIRFNCDKKQTFTELWRRILKEISLTYEQAALGFTSPKRGQSITASDLLANQEIAPDDIRLLFQKLPVHPIIILDELDRIEDPSVIGLLADTIKTLSDHASKVTLILVGVADTIEQLIEDHRSIERALVQIQLPRMNPKELHEALDKCLSEAEMSMEDEAKKYIITMSRGLPHYTHLLGLHAATVAHDYNRSYIVMPDVEQGMRNAIEDANESITSSYMEAIHDSKDDTRHKYVLLACALAEYNNFGFFSAVDVKLELSEILKKSVEVSWFARPMADFISPRRGKILQRIGRLRHYAYRFSNPLMQPFIIMKGIDQELIDYNRIKTLER